MYRSHNTPFTGPFLKFSADIWRGETHIPQAQGGGWGPPLA